MNKNEGKRTKYLAYVRTHPCLICGNRAQAHHLKTAYLGGMGKKVDDKFTVPLCALCHHELHRFGNEQTFWDLSGIDAMSWAEKTWRKYNAED